MSDDVTKLDKINKDDPALNEKTSELIARRAEEEKRKADLRKEMQMAKARADAKIKKNGNTTQEQSLQTIPPTPIQPIQESPSILTNVKSDEFISISKFQETLANVNRSFSWLENYVKEQNIINAKMDKFIFNLSKAIEEYNKK